MNVPNKSEVINLLNEHKGTAYVWRTLRNKYGPPENTYGSFVKDIISARKASTNASTGKNINASSSASPNAHSDAYGNASSSISGSKTANEKEHSELSIPMRIAKEPDAILPPPPTRIVYVPLPPPQLDIVAECEKTIEAMWRMLPKMMEIALMTKFARKLLQD